MNVFDWLRWVCIGRTWAVYEPRCVVCRTDWVAVVPFGMRRLKCPSCGASARLEAAMKDNLAP